MAGWLGSAWVPSGNARFKRMVREEGSGYRAYFGGVGTEGLRRGESYASDLPGTPTLVWGSFPCQDLSLAGNGAGLAGDRSGTFKPFWKLMRDMIRVAVFRRSSFWRTLSARSLRMTGGTSPHHRRSGARRLPSRRAGYGCRKISAAIPTAALHCWRARWSRCTFATLFVLTRQNRGTRSLCGWLLSVCQSVERLDLVEPSDSERNQFHRSPVSSKKSRLA